MIRTLNYEGFSQTKRVFGMFKANDLCPTVDDYTAVIAEGVTSNSPVNPSIEVYFIPIDHQADAIPRVFDLPFVNK